MAKIWEYVGNKSSCFLSIITLQVRYKKMENEIMSPCDGTVLSVNVTKGATVETGAVLCVIG